MRIYIEAPIFENKVSTICTLHVFVYVGIYEDKVDFD